MGGAKLRNTLRIGALGGPPIIVDLETAKTYVAKYRAKHPGVVKLWAQGETVLGLLDARVENYPWGPMVIDRGYIVLPGGMKLDYTGLRREEGEWRMYDRSGKLMRNAAGAPIRLYGAMFIENIVQALARVIMASAMPAIRVRAPIVLSTHDELGTLARKGEGQSVLDHMIATMTRRPPWMPKIPLAAEGGFDVCYSK